MMNFTFKTRIGFSMIELVMVIVVLGILASMALPRLDRDLRQEAADSILSAIRYTQHLAINDNKHSITRSDWHLSLWQIRFSGTTTLSYTIGSNTDYLNNIDKNEAAIDPITGKFIYNSVPTLPQPDESPDIFLTSKYGIINVAFTGCANSVPTALTTRHIAFDNLGRPFRGINGATNDYSRYVTSDCRITFISPAFSNDLVIQVNKETGYAFIVDQNSS